MTSTKAAAIPSSLKKEGSALSGILLVGGTSIGAGMLALPSVTGMAGFFPAMGVNLFCWLVMLATGLLFLEAALWMEKGANLLSIAEKLLGPVGKIVGGVAFIFLYYCLLVSYIAGGTPIFTEEIQRFSSVDLSGTGGYFLFSLFFGGIVFLGHRVVDRANWVLMISLILSYVLLIVLGSKEIVAKNLYRREWAASLFAAPILFSAYGYHNIVPTLTTYLNKNAYKLRLVIIFGTSIPFLVYSFWQWVIIGSVPPQELAASTSNGVPITFTLQEITGNRFLSLIGGYFGFFALVTSFLGVSLSMIDFFKDGFKISDAIVKKALLCLFIFLPPAFFAANNPTIFIEALGVAGGFGESILNGLFPVLMVWIGRYHLKLEGKAMLPGGKAMLAILAFFVSLIIVVEIFHIL